jgi:quercetin dioxygenase-like cupin family protein
MQTITRPTIQVGAIEVRFLVEAEECEGAATAFECTVPAGAMVPAPHSHDGFEETVYGFEGVTTFTVDGVSRLIGPGEALCIPRGHVHRFANDSDRTARFLSVATPGVFGPGYFREIAEVLTASAGGPPDVAAVVAVMRCHGLTPALPQPAGK